jgi:transcriptional regulator GlxA family with amidase domain
VSRRRLTESADDRPHHVVMLGFTDAQILDVAGPLEVFSRASRWLTDHGLRDAPAYTIELVAAEAGPLVMSNGLAISAARTFREVENADTLLVAGGIGYDRVCRDPEICNWLARSSSKVQRLGSICTGALILAAAGLLEGRRATTHWAYCNTLAEVAPSCEVDAEAIFVCTDHICTSAGVTTGIDMALAFVEEDHGKSVALAVAQELVLYLRRPGHQTQFSRHLAAEARDDQFGRLELWALDHLQDNLSVTALAEQCGMSERHFGRVFTATFGSTPGAWIARLRLEAAKRRIEQNAGSLKDVARQCGFGDEQRLRRAFQKSLGLTPSEYRSLVAASPGEAIQ